MQPLLYIIQELRITVSWKYFISNIFTVLHVYTYWYKIQLWKTQKYMKAAQFLKKSQNITFSEYYYSNYAMRFFFSLWKKSVDNISYIINIKIWWEIALKKSKT